jgi:putative transposase
MYLTVRQKVGRISYKQHQILKELSKAAKDLYNKATYIKRQNFFERQKSGEAENINYNRLYRLVKNEKEYKVLNSNMAQQILKLVDRNFSSFYGLLKSKKNGDYNEKVKLPNYLNKDAHFSLIIGFVRIKDNFTFDVPMSTNYQNRTKINFKIPPVLDNKIIKEIRIIPKQNAGFFEIQYVYEKEISNGTYNKNNALGIDLGINNLMTCAVSSGNTFIIDGRKIKSINQYANKKNAKLKSVLDKQGLKTSTRLDKLWIRRNNIINDYILKSCRYIVDYCKANDIGTVVLGFNKDMNRNINLGKKNNQNIAVLPMGKIKSTLEYMCKLDNIDLHIQEESYTSKASFFDKDNMAKDTVFSGRRVRRGLYKTGTGNMLNADINAALNILRKSNVVGLSALYTRGFVDVPKRIRLI